MGCRLLVDGLEWSFAVGEDPFLRLDRLELRAGDVVSLTGPSGAGKSTLLFLLAGLERVTRGRVLWGETDLAAMDEGSRDRWRRRSLALVFQDFQLIPELSALENVLLPLTFEGWSIPSAARERALGLLERLGVARFSSRAASLSRGEMQRVAVARALLKKPEILLADEPTASLDSANEEAVSTLLVEAAREEGATTIIATHHRSVRDRADRVIELSHGALAITEPGRTAV
jgi:putative ABC transport system ATP-binding protein